MQGWIGIWRELERKESWREHVRQGVAGATLFAAPEPASLTCLTRHHPAGTVQYSDQLEHRWTTRACSGVYAVSLPTLLFLVHCIIIHTLLCFTVSQQRHNTFVCFPLLAAEC